MNDYRLDKYQFLSFNSANNAVVSKSRVLRSPPSYLTSGQSDRGERRTPKDLKSEGQQYTLQLQKLQHMALSEKNSRIQEIADQEAALTRLRGIMIGMGK